MIMNSKDIFFKMGIFIFLELEVVVLGLCVSDIVVDMY